jgi:hypothetical protein
MAVMLTMVSNRATDVILFIAITFLNINKPESGDFGTTKLLQQHESVD